MNSRIEQYLSGQFEKDVFSAAMKNLEDAENPLRLNNFSYAMRELIGHVLRRLALDENVEKCAWYEHKEWPPETKKIITKADRLRYAVQGGLEDSYIEKTLGMEVKQSRRNIIAIVNRLSKFTHIKPGVFNLPRGEVDKLVEETIDTFHESLALINKTRKQLIETLWEHIDSAIINKAISETIQEIDALSSHHAIDEVYTDKVGAADIDQDFIRFYAKGSICCELQYGSNGDVDRGDGLLQGESFPFTCELTSPVDEPDSIDCLGDSFKVDTSSYEGKRYRDDMETCAELFPSSAGEKPKS